MSADIRHHPDVFKVERGRSGFAPWCDGCRRETGAP